MPTSLLFATWDGGGNVAPLLAIAAEAQRRGATVRVMGHAGQRGAVEAAGLRFEPYANAKPWSVTAPRSGLSADLGYAAVFADRGIGRDLIASLTREPADRVVVDGLLVGALSALRRRRVRYTILVHTLRSVMFRSLTSGPLGLVMTLRGHNPRSLYRRADAELIVTEQSLDPGSGRVPRTAHYTGAILPSIGRLRPDEVDPIVLVSLSTTYVAGQAELLQRIIEALAPRPVRTVVTTGPAVDPAALTVSENAVVRAYIPHTEALPRTSVVIGHGGHATTMLALAHGVPMLILPTNLSFDQPTIAHVVAANRLGRSLPKRASVEQIRAAFEDVLGSTEYRENAQQLGARMRAGDGLTAAVDLLLDDDRDDDESD
ncbi:glycosyltransferase [Naasia lichenicola]|uniref:Glycosyltransferase n=1 Tax=Naasia lichenicola TaxID=2565933 RepID=A0A4S4FLP3_9MICO|nr:nucleotide disphospho-sugar-binding domain-containing protein [Naasia lichenicola]THG30126.1 glycosyltransferase [Naasia lichenicola]